MKAIEHINLLGLPAEDKVTGFKGVVTNVAFDLYGCVQAVVSPRIDDKGEIPEGKWFDITRLNLGLEHVMDPPDFSKGYIATGKKGGFDKPLP